jgi:hypothetical protein
VATLGVTVAIAWVANYLYFTRFGLYEDDWFYAGWAFVFPVNETLRILWGVLTHPAGTQGRPLQFAFNWGLPLFGVVLDSFAANYVVGFLLFAASAAMLYRVLRHRFSNLVAALATLLFVLSPLHTLRQFLNGQYGFGPAFLCVFGAIRLYQRGRRGWAWALAPLSLLAYESIFFLFLGAPLFVRGRTFRGRGWRWLAHGGVCAVMVGLYFAARKFLLQESRVAALPGADSLLGPVLREWAACTFRCSATYYYAARRALLASGVEPWLWLAPALVAVLWLLAKEWRRLTPSGRRLALWLAAAGRPVAAGCAWLALGYATAYFFGLLTAGRFPYTDRMTRISVAASAGSSLMVAGVLAGALRAARGGWVRALAVLAVCVLFSVCFVYSFLIQLDYAEDWRAQLDDVGQIMALTPDARADTFILLRLPSVAPALPGEPGIGQDKTAFDNVFAYIFEGGRDAAPKLFIVMTDDWVRYLKRQPDGLMRWTEPDFPGRWYPLSAPFRADRFVRLEKLSNGRIVRRAEPVTIDGVDLHHAPAEADARAFWREGPLTRMGRKLLPAFLSGRR